MNKLYVPRFALLLGVFLAAGCQRQLAAPASEEKATAALTASLDAWKAGASPADLEARAPAIIINDPQWKNGVRLLDYQIQSGCKPAGQDLRYVVNLTLTDPEGKTTQTVQASYTIGTASAIVIVRDEVIN